MPRSRARAALAVAAGLAMAAATAGAATGAPTPDPNYGPPYQYTTELMGQFGTPIPLKNMALLTVTDHGYLYRAGQQNSHLTITLTDAGIQFVDTGTARWKQAVPTVCTQLTEAKGIGAVCPVPSSVSASQPLLVEVWPRLGDDYVDGHTLPDTVAMTVLADAGNDTALLGAGPDFFNGHSGHDVVYGGAGNDWIRSGLDADTVHAGAGNDKVVGQEGADTIYGDDGNDALYGSDGGDHIYAGSGTDRASCGSGRDSATIDSADRASKCEVVTRD
jgi:Ca2+-binding RTX toxin-like protein